MLATTMPAPRLPVAQTSLALIMRHAPLDRLGCVGFLDGDRAIERNLVISPHVRHIAPRRQRIDQGPIGAVDVDAVVDPERLVTNTLTVQESGDVLLAARGLSRQGVVDVVQARHPLGNALGCSKVGVGSHLGKDVGSLIGLQLSQDELVDLAAAIGEQERRQRSPGTRRTRRLRKPGIPASFAWRSTSLGIREDETTLTASSGTRSGRRSPARSAMDVVPCWSPGLFTMTSRSVAADPFQR